MQDIDEEGFLVNPDKIMELVRGGGLQVGDLIRVQSCANIAIHARLDGQVVCIAALPPFPYMGNTHNWYVIMDGGRALMGTVPIVFASEDHYVWAAANIAGWKRPNRST